MSIVLVGSTSGSVTLQEPAVAGTTVLTLPAVSGTILTTGSSGQSIPRAALPAGTVLQVVNASLGAGTVTTTSSTRSNTGLTATITPTSATSKILCLVDMVGCEKNSGSGIGPYLLFVLMRDSTDICRFEGQGGYTQDTSLNSFGACSTNFLDSPATTSAATYKVQFSNPANSGTVGFNNSSGTSTITLMEIAA
jgi:hypothetical protein